MLKELCSNNKTVIMGILNVTPDSFSDGGKFVDLDKAVAHAKQMVEDGADIIDIGGESTRPGSDAVSVEEERRRVIPIIEQLKQELVSIPISIDSMKPEVVDHALQAGASIVNDVTGLTNPDMVGVVAKHKASVVIMHMLGEPKTMQADPQYDDVIVDIYTFFEQQIDVANKSGITDIALDPGIGFGKTLEHNLTIFNELEQFTDLGFPIMIGSSRKSFIEKITGLPVEERLEGSLASEAVSVMNGANIVRVHDVKETRKLLDVVDAILNTKKNKTKHSNI